MDNSAISLKLGDAGLRKRLSHYSARFKLSVLNQMWQQGLSFNQVAALFDLRGGARMVSGWAHRYYEGGLDALEPKPRGRPKKMKNPENPSPAPVQPQDACTLEDLRKENEYLRAEVAYLKKLDALVRAKKYRSYRGEINSNVPNVLDRQFRADQPNQKWGTDVTEFNVRGDKFYLSPVMDLYNGEIVAYETRRTPQLPLVSNMLKRALSKLGDHQTPLLHSDQGWQYHMLAYRRQFESPRVLRRLQLLRKWSHEQEQQVFP